MSERSTSVAALFDANEFHARHIGPSASQQAVMLGAIGYRSRRELIRDTVPAAILIDDAAEPALGIGEAVGESAALAELRTIASRNEVWRSYLGCGYHGTITPEPIRRNVLENPGWYTAYTPYQAEIAQGRLEALMNFQQMVIDLTGLEVANASLLDEGTAAAEAMTMLRRAGRSRQSAYFVEASTHPHVIAVMRTRARWLGIDLVVAPLEALDANAVFGAHFQSPDTEGRVRDFSAAIRALHDAKALATLGVDPLASLLVASAGTQGADVAIGSAQRFGVPFGFGGPHAAFMATRQSMVRSMPGRIIGVAHDAAGHVAYRMSLQTREQHIRRDKATSNICTAQALLANMAAFYAIWHGPQGLRRSALRTHAMARLLIEASGLAPVHASFFDTVAFDLDAAAADAAMARARARRINLRVLPADGSAQRRLIVALDETVGLADVADVATALCGRDRDVALLGDLAGRTPAEALAIDASCRREDKVLTHPVFNRYRSETDFVRYLKRLENRDISLVHSMIPLGSCTMKLNAAAEMAPLSWPAFASIHPHVPPGQARGYTEMIGMLGGWLADITGFSAVSFQPNSGAQGEYAGLLAIRRYLAARGDAHRDVCLIPASAHGTNPASAQMMGMKIVVVACDADGNIDTADLAAKIAAHRDALAALMVTYPSTHGVFEASIKDICAQVHEAGGQVYMDGANLNAQCGLTKPGLIGADVCHLNLHKTFCIPHGGGGPGMGPIAVAAHLAPHLPDDPLAPGDSIDAVSSAPYGSASILTISWMYIRMMGASGLRQATEVAILNANYIAARLRGHYEVLYAGANGRVAHECILDLRHFKAEYGVSAEDVAKRLMDYGFHAPTLSFPVTDTLMVEPTESESQPELDRFCDAMIAIRAEIAEIAAGTLDPADNMLKHAPHTATEIAGDWQHGYSRDRAAFPLPWVREAKVWPSVKRIDNAAGDRQLICACPPISEYA